jgi:hypothetical protein
MKKVIDTNFFQDEALKAYLSADGGNKVVFTDYACMEVYKSRTPEFVWKSLAIVSSFPEQVIVLKSTRQIIRLKHSSSGLQKRLHDPVQTRSFQEFCKLTKRAAQGEVSLADKVREKIALASKTLGNLARDSEKIRTHLINRSCTFNGNVQ